MSRRRWIYDGGHVDPQLASSATSARVDFLFLASLAPVKPVGSAHRARHSSARRVVRGISTLKPSTSLEVRPHTSTRALERSNAHERANDMSEFAPPSYTGDPNLARCSEEYFKLGFWGLQFGLAFCALGGARFSRIAPGLSGDTALALSEEAANRRREKAGKRRRSHLQKGFGDKTGNAYQLRALDFRRQNMM